jgi:hypothetical protein
MAAATKLRLGGGLPDAGVYTKVAHDRFVSRMNAMTLRSPSISVGALISILTDPARGGKQAQPEDGCHETAVASHFGTSSTAPDARQPVLLLARHAGRAVIVSKLDEPRS